MRNFPRFPFMIAASTVFAVAVLACLSGCESQSDRASDAAPDQVAADPSSKAGPDTEAQARRLAEALARSEATQGPAMPTPEVLWIEPQPEARANAASPRVTTEADTHKAAAQTPTKGVEEPLAPDPSPSADAPSTTQPMSEWSRSALLDALIDKVRNGSGTAMQRALDEALLVMAEPGRGIDPAVMSPLSVDQREQVARYQGMIQLLRHQLTTEGGRINRDQIEAAMDELYGSATLEVRTVELCRRVEGFGVYQPFEGRTFMAGRDNTMIVYVELDHFTPVDLGNGLHEVRLSQDVALYTDWDGQKVWEHETQQIVDRSRNRRTDFFVVQKITLPARLNVGKYVLKVDVTDKHGGSVDGVPVEINLVADQALVRDDRGDRDDRRRVELIRELLEEEDDQPLLSR